MSGEAIYHAAIVSQTETIQLPADMPALRGPRRRSRGTETAKMKREKRKRKRKKKYKSLRNSSKNPPANLEPRPESVAND